LEGPYLAGYEIYHAFLDRRDGATGYAAAHHAVWGIHVYRSFDGGRSWDLLPEAPQHEAAEGADGLKAIWHLAPGHADEPGSLYAGIQPAGLGWPSIRSASTRATRGAFMRRSRQVASTAATTLARPGSR
jgi:hypothetical protein